MQLTASKGGLLRCLQRLAIRALVFGARVWLAARYRMRLKYSWNLAWLKAERR